MRTDFVLFGPAHLAVLAAIPVVAGLLVRFGRRRATTIRRSFGILLLANELVWNVYRVKTEGVRAPEGLPLQLCDLALWMTVAALLTLKPWTYQTAYYTGLGGSAMATLTPDLWAPSWSYPTAYFFLAHGGVIVAVLWLTWSGLLRPRPGSVWRALAVVNGFALLVASFNAAFHTNYMYLCRKPAGASALDHLGPWPVYLLAGETLAVALFTLLWLPFRGSRGGPEVQ
jgi:hypothetical integral membrane protein (TIGR02206 family)